MNMKAYLPFVRCGSVVGKDGGGELGLWNFLLILVYLCVGLEGNREGNLGCEIFFLFWSTYGWGWKGNRERNWGRGIFILFWSMCTL
jgi:hypothetical protein